MAVGSFSLLGSWPWTGANYKGIRGSKGNMTLAITNTSHHDGNDLIDNLNLKGLVLCITKRSRADECRALIHHPELPDFL